MCVCVRVCAGSALASVEMVIDSLVQDVQERLIYRVQLFIENDLGGFEPTEADLDYPAKLQSKGVRGVVA